MITPGLSQAGSGGGSAADSLPASPVDGSRVPSPSLHARAAMTLRVRSGPRECGSADRRPAQTNEAATLAEGSDHSR